MHVSPLSFTIPADTKHNTYVVLYLCYIGYVKILLDVMLECLVF